MNTAATVVTAATVGGIGYAGYDAWVVDPVMPFWPRVVFTGALGGLTVMLVLATLRLWGLEEER